MKIDFARDFATFIHRGSIARLAAGRYAALLALTLAPPLAKCLLDLLLQRLIDAVKE